LAHFLVRFPLGPQLRELYAGPFLHASLKTKDQFQAVIQLVNRFVDDGDDDVITFLQSRFSKVIRPV
jgi:hypothetical protein